MEAGTREQKLMGLLFDIAQISAQKFHNQDIHDGSKYDKIREPHLRWVAEQLIKNGFPVKLEKGGKDA